MKLICTKEAEGSVLCHDITQIIKGVTKDARFRKGHIVTKEDIPVLLSLGKDHLYVWEKDENMLHEDEAAEYLRRICQNAGMKATLPKEGKIELIAEEDGLFTVDKEKLLKVNSQGQMMIAARHGNTPVKRGDKLAGTRIIPLVIEKQKMENIENECGPNPIFSLHPFEKKKTAILTTGNEVYYGRIKDTFTPVVEQKLGEYDVPVVSHRSFPDDDKQVTAAILEEINKGAEMVICTGGMSVDPDDKTPLAIKNTGAAIISYGSPVLPGAMFLLAYDQKNIPIVGLPGCVMYAKRTIFDLVLPRLLANSYISARELAQLGEGGLCLNCDNCTYPNCGFGKGW